MRFAHCDGIGTNPRVTMAGGNERLLGVSTNEVGISKPRARGELSHDLNLLYGFINISLGIPSQDFGTVLGKPEIYAPVAYLAQGNPLCVMRPPRIFLMAVNA